MLMQMNLPPTAFDIKWSMLGTAVRVHPTFFLFSLFMAYREKIPFTIVLAVMATHFLSILVHEFGHALSHRYYGDRNPSVLIYFLGGLCFSGSKELQRQQKINMLLWGPGAGFILGALAYGIGAVLFGPGFILPGPVASVSSDGMLHLLIVLDALVWFNLLWGMVNLVPVLPLDGGQLLETWIGWKRPSLGMAFVAKVSFFAAILCAVLSLVVVFFYGSRQLGPAILFGMLAYNSWTLRKHLEMYGEPGDFGGGQGPRDPWEQDADWWKKS